MNSGHVMQMQRAAGTTLSHRPMRVLHAIGSITRVHGGVTTALLNTIAALHAQGIDSEVITTDNDGAGQRMRDVVYATVVDYEGVHVRFFPLQTRFYSASLPMLHWLRTHIRSYDLVHAHSLFNFTPGAAAHAARHAGVPYVISPHGVLEHWGMRNRRRRLKQASVRLFEGPLLAGAAAVVFTSASEREQAQGLTLPVRQPVIPLAVPLPESQIQSATQDQTQSRIAHQNRDRIAPAARTMADDAAAEHPISLGTLPEENSELNALAGGPWALFMARIDPKKGIERLLQAFSRVLVEQPDARLVIAGSGPEAYVNTLRQHCSGLGIAERVLWTGFVAGARKDWLLRNCTAFVLASDSENFGIAPIEAMACGRPVVLSSGVAVAELVSRWDAGSVTSLDPSDIAGALLRTFADPEHASEQGGRGRAGVAAELSLQSHGARMADLYRDIVGQTAPPRRGDPR